MLVKLIYLPRLPFLLLIRLYQKTLSPDHGVYSGLFPHGYCRFYPSCSEYSFQSIRHKGLVRGLFKTTWRILRCNPFTKGGIDLP
jgi:putative membrane protein insertion efficiency factor